MSIIFDIKRQEAGGRTLNDHKTRPLQYPRRHAHLALMLAVGLAVSGCVQTKSFTHDNVSRQEASSGTILLMPPDVKLYQLHASGARDLKADWSETARTHVVKKLREKAQDFEARIVRYDTADDGVAKIREPHQPAVNLHQRVGRAIRRHKYTPKFALPTKDDVFDWTLGQTVDNVSEEYPRADHALFVHFADSHSTAGRAALIFGAALLGVSVQGGQQVGFASLVDLDSGRISWFNAMRTGFGDLREAKGATRATEAVLEDIPL